MGKETHVTFFLLLHFFPLACLMSPITQKTDRLLANNMRLSFSYIHHVTFYHWMNGPLNLSAANHLQPRLSLSYVDALRINHHDSFHYSSSWSFFLLFRLSLLLTWKKRKRSDHPNQSRHLSLSISEGEDSRDITRSTHILSFFILIFRIHAYFPLLFPSLTSLYTCFPPLSFGCCILLLFIWGAMVSLSSIATLSRMSDKAIDNGEIDKRVRQFIYSDSTILIPSSLPNHPPHPLTRFSRNFWCWCFRVGSV